VVGNNKALGVICARGGSKGIPKKNLRLIGAIPLIGWSINSARQCKFLDRIIVSTDDKEIASVAKKFGAEVPFLRPGHLARDDSAEWLAWRHAIEYLEETENFCANYLVVLPPTSPFRRLSDIEKSIELIEAGDVDMVVSATMARRNPYFNMIELNAQGYASLSKPNNRGIFRRQEAPAVYDMTTVVYTSKTEYIKKANGIFDGRVKSVVVSEISGIDIDTEFDLQFAEFLHSKRLVGQHEEDI